MAKIRTWVRLGSLVEIICVRPHPDVCVAVLVALEFRYRAVQIKYVGLTVRRITQERLGGQVTNIYASERKKEKQYRIFSRQFDIHGRQTKYVI